MWHTKFSNRIAKIEAAMTRRPRMAFANTHLERSKIKAKKFAGRNIHPLCIHVSDIDVKALGHQDRGSVLLARAERQPGNGKSEASKG